MKSIEAIQLHNKLNKYLKKKIARIDIIQLFGKKFSTKPKRFLYFYVRIFSER